MEVIIAGSPAEASEEAARIFARQVRTKPASVLGLATGSTPLALYRALAERHARGELDFSGVTTFNLDEYVGLAPDHPQSYAHFMREHFFSRVNVPADRIHLPDGLARDIPAHCEAYEAMIRAAGGIDLQLLGLGSDGHIGFNEPSSSLASRTRLKTLTPGTIRDNARFFASPGRCRATSSPWESARSWRRASAWCWPSARGKAAAVAATVEGPVTADVPASALQFHAGCKLLIDEEAAGELRRAEYYRWVYDNKPGWQRP